MLASAYGFSDVVRELIAADGSAEHLRMRTKSLRKHGFTAFDMAKNDEIEALLTAAEAAANLKGKAQEEEKGGKGSACAACAYVCLRVPACAACACVVSWIALLLINRLI